MIKKICIITAARSEYGLLRWLMQEIKDDGDLELQIIVTGSHLSNEFGLTYKEIEKDGFIISAKVEMLLSSITNVGVVKSMGICCIGIADALERLKPDIIIILGDRYELLPICSAALIMNIPIAHISGGDITEGAIDDQIRHSITKLANIHFPGNVESAKRIVQMGENPKMVFVVGEPGLDNFKRCQLISKEELSDQLGLNPASSWIILTYHPETKRSIIENLEIARNVINALKNLNNTQVIITKSNADVGGREINDFFTLVCKDHPIMFKLFENLGQERYISLLKTVKFMIGNSSSGIVESPVIPLPVINIGERQKGRYISNNILCCDGSLNSISQAINQIMSDEFNKQSNNISHYYGSGNTSIQIKKIIKKLNTRDLVKAKFYEE